MDQIGSNWIKLDQTRSNRNKAAQIRSNWTKLDQKRPFLVQKYFFTALHVTTLHTLYNAILRIARNFRETRENIKISTHLFYHINLGWFSWEWSKKKIIFSKKKIQNGRLKKKAHFSKSPILKKFSRKFLRLVLGLVGLNYAKGIDLAQPIWLWSCPT